MGGLIESDESFPKLWLYLSSTPMVVVAGEIEEADKCPVIKEWLQLDDVVSKAASKGTVALVWTKTITRETVCDNHELLEPVVIHLGSSPALNLYVKQGLP